MGTDTRMRYHYEVQVPAGGGDQWWPLCEGVDPEAVGAVVVALLKVGGGEPHTIKVVKRPAD